MKLFHSPYSPFVRKVMVVAHEVGLVGRIECLPGAAHPTQCDHTLPAQNPLAPVPTLIGEDGQILADSRVICEYLDTLGQGTLFPRSGPARWVALVDQSMADGLLDAALLIRYERTIRPETERSDAWLAGQRAKIEGVLGAFEEQADAFGDRVDIGTIAIGCALGYLDLRFGDWPWRDTVPKLAAWAGGFGARPAMVATRPPDPVST